MLTVREEDCYYLHMIVPSGEEVEPISDKKPYYEVGCKIFEINKIFK
jgi:hypothetical protein